MAEVVEKVSGETRWTIATKALTGVLIATGKTLRDIVGEERFDEIWGQIWAGAGKASKEIADALGLAGNDAKSVAEAFQSVVLVSMGPEIKSETVEATADKAVVRVTGCPWWNRFNELGIPEGLCAVADPAFCNAFAKTFNPKMTVTLTKSMPRGDPHCEWLYEIQT